MKNYYRILEVKENCDGEEIRRSYRRLAMEFHPDRNQGSRAAERIFKEIVEAYGILGDPEKRREYDATIKSGNGSAVLHRENSLTGLFAKPEFRQTLRTVFNVVGSAGQAGRRLLRATPFLAAAAGGVMKKILASTNPPAEKISPSKKDITFRIFLTAKEFAAGKTIDIYSQSRDHKRLRVNIPPGSRPGQRLRLVGHGHAGKGDLFLLLLKKSQSGSAQSV